MKTIMNMRFLISVILLLPFSKLSAQELIKYKKPTDFGEIVFLGKLDTANVITVNYLLLKANNQRIDTIWKSAVGALDNNNLEIIDLFLKDNFCTFLLSTPLGINMVIRTKDALSSKWMPIAFCEVPITEHMKVKSIFLKDEKTVICEYNSLPTVIYKYQSGELIKN